MEINKTACRWIGALQLVPVDKYMGEMCISGHTSHAICVKTKGDHAVLPIGTRVEFGGIVKQINPGHGTHGRNRFVGVK